jgi:hypothetical protein
MLDPAGGGYVPVRPNAVDILPMAISVPVAGNVPIYLNLQYINKYPLCLKFFLASK